MQQFIVPIKRAEVLYERYETVVLSHRRPVVRVSVLQITTLIRLEAFRRNRIKGRVPVNRIVTPRFPRVNQRNHASAMRVTTAIEPFVPAIYTLQ